MIHLTINRGSTVPLYAQLSDSIKKAILAGELAYHEKLPSENELITESGLSRITVRSALDDLSSQKLIEKYRGKGAYVIYDSSIGDIAGNIDVLLDAGEDDFPSGFFKSISYELEKERYRFSFHDTENSQKKIASILNGILLSGSSGILLQTSRLAGPTGPELSDALMRLTSSGIPYQFLDNTFPGMPGDRIVFDNYTGGVIAAEYLISLGHIRFAMLTDSRMCENTDRFRGFASVLAANHLPTLLDIPADNELPDTLPNEIREKEITALFCYSDRVACDAMRLLQQAGVRIPQDVSVIGFGDTVIASSTMPQMTSVIHPREILGSLAARNLIRKIQGVRDLLPVDSLQPRLRIRTSCAQPRIRSI